MTALFTKEQLEYIQNQLEPLKVEIAKQKYELRKTQNELYKLKDSLIYRNMAARIIEPRHFHQNRHILQNKKNNFIQEMTL